MKPRVLILMGGYWPGHDSSGPNLSLRAMCEALSGDIEFMIAARDRPFDAAVPLVAERRWFDRGFARVRYLESAGGAVKGVGRLIAQTPHDVLHLNSFFDRDFTIPALIHRRLGSHVAPALLSPRGEFSTGALGLNAWRKRVFRRGAAATGLTGGLLLHATSEAEQADLRRAFPRHQVRLVTNFRPLGPTLPHVPRTPGDPLRVAFLGRISPVKGLDVALRSLARVKSPVRFTIYGPVEDCAYWAACRALIAGLPPHVIAAAAGELPNTAVGATMAAQDLMFLPSLSENFGHAIFEALAAGTPVLIGDSTPWRGLAERHAGFDLPLADLAGLSTAIDRIGAADMVESARWRTGARAAAEGFVAESQALPQMRGLYQELADRMAA